MEKPKKHKGYSTYDSIPYAHRRDGYRDLNNPRRYRPPHNAGWVPRLVRSWYGWAGKRVPEIGTPEYDAFVAGTAGMILRTLNYNRDLSAGVKVYVGDQATATCHYGHPLPGDKYYDESVDRAGWIITLPAWCVSKAAYEKLMPDANPQDMADVSVAVINGFLSHEALHVLHTGTNTKNRIAEMYSAKDKFGKSFLVALDVMEDLYIESKAGYWGGEFLQALNQTLTSPEQAMRAVADFVEKPSLYTALAALVLLNNDEFDQEVWQVLPDEVKAICNDLPGTKTAMDRGALAYRLCELFPPDAKASREAGDGSRWDTNVSGLERDLYMCAQPEVGMQRRVLLSRSINTELEKSTSGWYGDRYFVSSGDISKVPKVKEMEVSDMKYDGKSLSSWLCVDNDMAFIRLVKALRTINHAPGPPEDKGPTIVSTRLSRIASDGKVFARQYDDARHQRVEVILLVDLSGSTGNYMTLHGKEGTKSIYTVELSSAYRMFLSLREAGVPCAVYAHTSQVDHKTEVDTPVLYHLTSYDMPGKSADPQTVFEKAHELNKRENYDGYILEKLAKAFSGKRARNVIIHLSDGEPSGDNYRDKPPRDHTMGIVKWLRSIGIDVFSLSVARAVVVTNNELYGQKYNLDASRDLDAQMKALVADLM